MHVSISTIKESLQENNTTFFSQSIERLCNAARSQRATARVTDSTSLLSPDRSPRLFLCHVVMIMFTAIVQRAPQNAAPCYKWILPGGRERRKKTKTDKRKGRSGSVGVWLRSGGDHPTFYILLLLLVKISCSSSSVSVNK